MTLQDLKQEMLDQGIEIGKKEGRAEERTKMIKAALYQLKSVGQTAKILGLDFDEVWSVVKAEHILVDDRPS